MNPLLSKYVNVFSFFAVVIVITSTIIGVT